jgi:5-aminopentanamidase
VTVDQLPLTLVSTRPRLGDKARNLERIASEVRAARGDLVVFPEMALTGYLVRDAVLRLAETVEGPSVRRLSKLASETGRHILVGLPRRDEERVGLVYNCAALFDPDEGIQLYDKRQLATFGPFEDGLFFSPGTEPGFMETPWGHIGVSICYDLFFPELMRAQALAGAVLLVNVSASPSTSRRFFEVILPARAIENALPVAYTNFAGTQESLVFWGGAQLWGPRGTLKDISPYYEEARLETSVDLEEARAARPLRPTVRDARKALVQDLMDVVN